MILDNSTEKTKVINWIKHETPNNVKFNIVTGYFTIGALSEFLELTEGKITETKIIIGDLLLSEPVDNPIDILNGDLSLENAFQISQKARNVITFLEKNEVCLKILEPNFCHAKVYLAISDESHTKGYYITGSSNLTEAGLGIKTYNNVELNIFGQPTDPRYGQVGTWFSNLWTDTKAKESIKNEAGTSVSVKQYLIDLLKTFFKKYTPEEIYYKILFELFKNQIGNGSNIEFERELGRLENSFIYRKLYEFQQKGVISLIKMLNKYNGAILADAVGLGKTWSALAVIKYYQNKGYQVIVLAPKKLYRNWQKYHYLHKSLFQEDRFDYIVRYHTDLQDERLESRSDGLRINEFFQSDKPKLFVIDESHNLRNSKSNRYQFLVENILNYDYNPNHKVLLLTATPINTSLVDIKNQFKLLVANKNGGFKEPFGISNVDSLFAVAQRKFKEWRTQDGSIQQLINMLPENFAYLADNLIVARTRKIIQNISTNLYFPKPEQPRNFYVTPEQIGSFESFNELFKKFPPNLAAYSPYLYLSKKVTASAIEDEWQRDAFLVKMMYILMTKRLESSWYSFYLTLEKIKAKTIEVYEAVKKYEEIDLIIRTDPEEITDEDEDDTDEYSIGKREIKLSEIADSNNLEKFKNHLKADIESLRLISDSLKDFQSKISAEKKNKSVDRKLEDLINNVIIPKQKSSINKKVLIFTVFKTTAFYLYHELTKRGFSRVAVISGDESRYYKSQESCRNFESILERFCPYTTLYRERVWKDFENTLGEDKKTVANFPKWKEWVKANDSKTSLLLDEEIDILIATDCLSEGQNLQDCDTVVNYDIHWNPVRVIQRIGRIDRLESPNPTFLVVNFWPTKNINKYLDLENRIVDRLVAARLAGTEVDPDLIKRLTTKLIDDDTDKNQTLKLLKQMQQSIEDLNDDSKNFGFSDLSLDIFRQDLLLTMKEDLKKWAKIPKASFSGFLAKNKTCCPEEGIIALLGYPSRNGNPYSHSFKHFKLLYLNMKGKALTENQMEVLLALNVHFREKRNVPDLIDKRNLTAMQEYQRIIESYFANCIDPESSEGRNQQTRMIEGLRHGSRMIVDQIMAGEGNDALNEKNNYELLAWMIIR